MATIRWCPIYPKWDSYQPLYFMGPKSCEIRHIPSFLGSKRAPPHLKNRCRLHRRGWRPGRAIVAIFDGGSTSHWFETFVVNAEWQVYICRMPKALEIFRLVKKTLSVWCACAGWKRQSECFPANPFHTWTFKSFSQRACIIVCLVVDLPLWKMMEFVSWDDDIPNTIWKNIQKMFQTTNQ